MSSSFGSWCSWTKQEGWVNIRFIFLFLVLIRWNEKGRWVALAIKSMMVGFCFIGGWCYSEWWVWDLITLAVSGKWNVSRVIPRLYGWVYKTLRLSLLVVKHSVVVMTAGSQSRQSQIESYVLPIFDSSFKRFVFRISGSIKFWDPVEDSNTGSLSSITVRMGYIFAF